mmetsp:Transcript_108985/g.314768  ORF Transcript_108985/g.314768 Transcript_108985/m.314768 type:complete len:275 (-) Transcript_108985:989-1813(-)
MRRKPRPHRCRRVCRRHATSQAGPVLPAGLCNNGRGLPGRSSCTGLLLVLCNACRCPEVLSRSNVAAAPTPSVSPAGSPSRRSRRHRTGRPRMPSSKPAHRRLHPSCWPDRRRRRCRRSPCARSCPGTIRCNPGCCRRAARGARSRSPRRPRPPPRRCCAERGPAAEAGGDMRGTATRRGPSRPARRAATELLVSSATRCSSSTPAGGACQCRARACASRATGSDRCLRAARPRRTHWAPDSLRRRGLRCAREAARLGRPGRRRRAQQLRRSPA